jgi:hypothetical protein
MNIQNSTDRLAEVTGHEAVIRLKGFGPNGLSANVDTVNDIGFIASLVLPPRDFCGAEVEAKDRRHGDARRSQFENDQRSRRGGLHRMNG